MPPNGCLHAIHEYTDVGLADFQWFHLEITIRDVHSRPKSHPNHGANTANLSPRDNTKTCRI